MIKALPITSFVKLDLPSINKLANEFLSTQNLSGTEGKCAAMAKAFSEFLKQKKVPSQIIDARNYKGPLKNVGNSNHVLDPARTFSYSDNVVATHMIRNGVPA